MSFINVSRSALNGAADINEFSIEGRCRIVAVCDLFPILSLKGVNRIIGKRLHSICRL